MLDVVDVRDFGTLGSPNDGATITKAIAAAPDYARVYIPPGVWRADSIRIDGKRGLTVWQPDGALKTPDAPQAQPMFRVGDATANHDLTLDLAEIDGNNFVGGPMQVGIRVRRCDGFTFRGYVHHTWNHALQFDSAQSNDIDVDLRVDHIGIGYATDPTFMASYPRGCAISFSAASAPTDTRIRLRGSDIKGYAGVYIAAATRMTIDAQLRRTGFRGIFSSGANSITGLRIIDPQFDECGALYESATPAGDARYGEGTNGIYVGDSPVTPEDCIVSGGTITRTGENAFEGRGIVTGLTTVDTGYRWPGFGANVARSAVFLHPGSRIKGSTHIRPGYMGVSSWWPVSTGVASNITVDAVTVIDPETIGVRILQQGGGVVANTLVTGCRIVATGATAPTHGISILANTGATLAPSTLAVGNTCVGAFSVADVAVAAAK